MQNHCEISWHELFGRTIVSIQISQRRDKFVLVKYPNKTLRNKYALGYGLFIRANEGSGTPVEFDDYEEVERLRTARAKNS